MTDCKHDHIKTWRLEDGTPAGLWSCVDCAMKFVPLAYAMDAVNAERERCRTACYVKAYEINAMGNLQMSPSQAAEACAKAIEQLEPLK